MQELNSKSFEFNSKGLNKDYELEVSKNVKIFGGASINGEGIFGKVWGSTQSRKGMGLFLQVCCDKFQIKGIFDIAP